MNQNQPATSLAEKMVDSQLDTFSLRDIISRVFLRPKLFLFAFLVPPLIAVLLSSIVPVEWTASTKILIRYSTSESGPLKDLVSDGRLGLSGVTSAELIKSNPVIRKTIQEVGISEKDIYRKPMDVISDTISGIVSPFFGKNNSADGKSAQNAVTTIELIKKFKDSLESSSQKSRNSKSIEILEKPSQVPELMNLDELITLEVKSFNREKVADMSNGLARAFIDEYYRLYINDVSQQYLFLNNLVTKEQDELKLLESATPADFASGNIKSSSGQEFISRDVPILTSMANQLMEAEAELTKVSQIYSSNSPQVSRLNKQVSNLKFMLKKQERIEISKQLLEQLKSRRYQAVNTFSIYKNRQAPISIVELATEPQNSKSKKIIRVIISGVIGVALGGMLAVGLMVILNVLDPRIYFRKDIENLVNSPIISYLPKIKKFKLSDFQLLRNDSAVEQGVWQIISKIGQKNVDKAKVITIASPGIGDGATFCVLALALNMAKNKKQKVCLIDANFNDATVTKLFDMDKQNGLIEAIQQSIGNISFYDEKANIFIIGAGNPNHRNELGYYADKAMALLSDLKEKYDYIVIDAGSALKSNEAVVFGGLADEVLVIASSGITRKGMLRTTVNKLQFNNIKVSGVVLNQSKEVLPAFIYRML